jgi:hypothetical protein
MAIVLNLAWPGVTQDAYDELLNVVDWEGQPADGCIFHVAWFDDKGLRATDVWESAQAWDTYFKERLAPGLEQLGIEGDAKIEIAQVHRYFDTADARGAGNR